VHGASALASGPRLNPPPTVSCSRIAPAGCHFKRDLATGLEESKLKVTCKESEIDALSPEWRSLLELMGLSKAKFDFRGKEF
jgi:hypothetical protein